MKIKNFKQIIRGWFPTEPKISNNWSKNKIGIAISVVVSFSLISYFLISSSTILLAGDQKIMKIAIDYVEENYGTDYVINGEVSNHSLTESRSGRDTIYNYPTASFRIPSDYYESGYVVNVMVDPDTEEIVKVVHSNSKGFPPYAIDVLSWEIEVRQSESTSTNITLTLVYPEEEVTVSFSLTLGAYQNIPVALDYHFPFEVNFEPEQLVLKNQEPKNTMLTLTTDSDAPLGLYTLTIHANDGNKGIGATFTITVVE